MHSQKQPMIYLQTDRSCRNQHTSTTEDTFRDLINNHKAQSSAYVKRAMRRETDTQTLFGTLGDNEFRKCKRELLEKLTPDYAHTGAGFRNAKPHYQSSFIVHPEWVSEQATQYQKTVQQQAAESARRTAASK